MTDKPSAPSVSKREHATFDVRGYNGLSRQQFQRLLNEAEVVQAAEPVDLDKLFAVEGKLVEFLLHFCSEIPQSWYVPNVKYEVLTANEFMSKLRNVASRWILEDFQAAFDEGN